MVPSNSFLNRRLNPRVSDFIYYHMYFEFGNICMFLTSIFADFCVSCAHLTG